MTFPVAQLTRFDATKRLTKRIGLDAEGRITKESASLARGTAQRVEVADAQELAHLLTSLQPAQALAYGVTERLSARIGPRDHLRPGEVSRTREHFTWPAGPGVLFLDLDGEFNPGDVPRLADTLAAALPEIASAPQVWQQSSSGGIHDPATGETRRGGLHCLVLVADAQAIPSIGDRLARGLWLNGHGHHLLSKGENPAALERCLVDTSVWQPERLDYAAPPVLADGLERVGGHVVAVRNGDAAPLDPATITPLSAAQEAAVSAAKAESKAQALEGVRKARAALLEALPAHERQQQRQRWLAMDRQTLTPDARLILRDGRTITAGDVLADPGRFDGAHCRDPMDPHNDNANDTQARIYADAQGCRVWSLAHGGRLFRIAPEVPQEAMQAAPDVLALAPEPARDEVIGACYRHGATAKAEGMVAAAAEVGASLPFARKVWLDHLARQSQPLHTTQAPEATFGHFEEVANEFTATPRSLFTLAKLGAGKTKELGGRVVRQARAQGRPVLSVTVLRALTWQNAQTFEADHYTDAADVLSAAEVVSTTVHSLHSPKLAGFLDRLADQRGVVVIDEAANVASLLFTSGGILGDHQRHEILRTLEALALAGVQFLMLDGDATPSASVLADMLSCRVVECTEQEFPDPAALVMPVQKLEEASTTPAHRRIVKSLAAGKRVVLACDSREQADRLHTMYAGMAKGGALCVHSRNADGPEQAAFRANPNAQAQRWQLVTYSPALSVGVSVTSVAAEVFVFASAGSIDAAGLWQLARRYRRAAGGLVRFIVGGNLCRPQRQPLGLREIHGDVAAHAQALDMLTHAPEIRGMVAATWQRNLYDANPLHALVGHLRNIGIKTRLAHPGDTSGAESRKLAAAAVRESRIERAATAERLSPAEALTFERHARAVAEDQDRLERHHIEEGLSLGHGDYEPDGSLPRELVEDAIYNGLTKQVRRLSWLHAAAQGADLERRDVNLPGFAYMRHQNAQARLMLDILAALEEPGGAVVVTAAKAQDVANTFRRRFHVAYSDLGKSRPPKKGARPERFTRWLRDLLPGWGFECTGEDQSWARDDTRGQRAYHYEVSDYVGGYAVRLSRHHLAESDLSENGLEPAWLSGLSGYATSDGVYINTAPGVATQAA